MRTAVRVSCLLAVLGLLVCGAFAPLPALAQSPQPEGVAVYSVVQDDLDGDRQPDLTIISCSFATGNDVVQVYDGSRDMVRSADWHQATDFDDDTWLFDVGADGTANLIIVFAGGGDRQNAYLYDDRDGDGEVRYRVRQGRVSVNESRFWTVRVTAHGSWWTPDGEVNRDLVISVDGPVGTLGLDHEYVLQRQVNDGIIDLEIETRPGASSGMAWYSLARSFSPIIGGIPRTAMRINLPTSVMPQIVGYVFWPHIGPGLYAARGAWELAPALKMQWQLAQFDRQKGLNDIIQRIPPEVGWRVYSSDPTLKGRDNPLGFENPFAFYDLAADRDGWPELIIRHTHSLPGTMWYIVGNNLQFSLDPRNTGQVVRYTWDRDNDGYWDYKLGLIGRNQPDTVVSFPDFGIVTLDYEKLPWMLTEGMSWDGATFVEVEGQAEASPEGVYEWDDILPLSRSFMFGIGDVLQPGMDDIRANFRGEYRVTAFEAPMLYCSAVDAKLHLLGAKGGVWNVDGTQRLRYADLDSDGYMDQWVLTVTPEADQASGAAPEWQVQSLQVAGDFLLYGDTGRVRLMNKSVPSSLFETLPPRDHEEWLALAEQQDRYEKDWAPDDLLSMMHQFQGPTTEVEGATLEAFRVTDDGFRFVLNLRPGYEIPVDDMLLTAGLGAGSYLVSYDGAFQVQALTPPQISMPAGALTLDPAAPQQLQWVTVRAVLRNDGLQDVVSLPVRLYVGREGEEPQLLATESISLLGKDTYALAAIWPPAHPGRWRIWLEADAAAAIPDCVELGPLAEAWVEVNPAPQAQMFAPGSRYDGVRLTWPVALLLSSTGLAAIAAALIILGGFDKPDAGDSGSSG